MFLFVSFHIFFGQSGVVESQKKRVKISELFDLSIS